MSQNWRKKKTGYQVRTNLVSFRSWAVVVVVVVVVSFLSTGFLLYMIGHHMIHCKTPKWEPNEPPNVSKSEDYIRLSMETIAIET